MIKTLKFKKEKRKKNCNKYFRKILIFREFHLKQTNYELHSQ